MNMVFIDLVLVFVGTGVVIAAVYTTMKWGIAENFFNWACYGRIALLEAGYFVALMVLGSAALDGVKDSALRALAFVAIGVTALVYHYWALQRAHSWTRRARQERRSQPFGLRRT